MGAGGLSVVNTGALWQSRQLNIALDNGETLKLDDAFFGTIATLQFANGDVLDLETLVSEQLATLLSLRLGDAGGRVYGGAGADGTTKSRQSKPRHQQHIRQRALHRTRNANRIAQRHVLLSALHRADVCAMQARLEGQRFLRPAQCFALCAQGESDAFFWGKAFVHIGIGSRCSLLIDILLIAMHTETIQY